MKFPIAKVSKIFRTSGIFISKNYNLKFNYIAKVKFVNDIGRRLGKYIFVAKQIESKQSFKCLK